MPVRRIGVSPPEHRKNGLGSLMGYRRGFIRGRVASLAGAVVMLAAGVGMIWAQTAGAASGPVAYSVIPTVIPGNVPSLGYEATSTSEFGDEVGLVHNGTPLASARVLMSSWGCQFGSGTTCSTNPGS